MTRLTKPAARAVAAVAITLGLYACGSAVSTTNFKGEQRQVAQAISNLQSDATATDQQKLCSNDLAASVVARLNALYEGVVPVILSHGGHANKFIGDGLLAVFGAPERHADHAARAVAAAREIAQLVRQGGAGDLEVGVGVNSGRVVVGTIGGGGRRDFTVIGDPVNTVARVRPPPG